MSANETRERVDRMPVLYLSHGAPPLAEDPIWPGQLAAWSAELPRPTAILVVSAHWEDAPVTLGATTTVPLLYDFWGFPEHYYRVRYAAPGAPELAAKVRALLGRPGQPVHEAPTRGLDHGAYVPLVEMYPDADIPVLQLAADPGSGRSLRPRPPPRAAARRGHSHPRQRLLHPQSARGELRYAQRLRAGLVEGIRSLGR